VLSRGVTVQPFSSNGEVSMWFTESQQNTNNEFFVNIYTLATISEACSHQWALWHISYSWLMIPIYVVYVIILTFSVNHACYPYLIKKVSIGNAWLIVQFPDLFCVPRTSFDWIYKNTSVLKLHVILQREFWRFD
jgi:hypothetical protein